MKLQLDPSAVAAFATRCGTVSSNLLADSTKVLGAFAEAKHDPFTRKDVVAVLLYMGATDEVHAGEPWAIIGEALRTASKRTVGRGYYSQFTEGELPALPVTKPAPKATKPKLPSGPTVTSAWFEEQIRDRALDRKVAALLRRKFPYENPEDLLAETREWFVRWSNRGTCDEFIKKGKPPTLTILTVWVEGKLTHRLYKEGQDALQREFKGVRTQGEVRRTRETGEVWLRDEATHLDPHAPQAIWVGDVEDSDGRTREFIDPNVEESAPLFEESELGIARDLVRARRRRAADRYARIFDHIMDGRSKEEAALLEGCSELRITHLFQRVRDDLRKAPSLLEVAMKVLKVIAEEPYSTVGEIEEELPRAKDLRPALDFLKLRGLAQEGAGECYAPTDLGHQKVEIGSFI